MPKTKLINTTAPGKPSTPIYRSYDGLTASLSSRSTCAVMAKGKNKSTAGVSC